MSDPTPDTPSEAYLAFVNHIVADVAAKCYVPAKRLVSDDSLLSHIRNHVQQLTEQAELITPKCAAQLLKVDQRILPQIATPIRLTHRLTRYKLSEITKLSQ